MTVILPEKVKCPGCGEAFEAFVLRSWSSGAFSDFRRVDCVRCPVCGRGVEGNFIEFTDPDAELRADPRFEEERDPLEPGETEVTFGEWIPGSRRPKEES